MKIAFLTSRYPSEENIYAHSFVHFRAKEYLKKGHKVVVYVPSIKYLNYNFEGVDVKLMPAYEISKLIILHDALCFHLLNIYPDPRLSGWSIYKSVMQKKIPSIFYMHGSEVQTTKVRRYFDSTTGIKQSLKDFYKDYVFIPRIKKFVSFIDDNFSLITPSVWMKKEAESELGLNLKNVKIYPNGIDVKLFNNNRGNVVDKYKLITIRPLSNKKYAVDLAIEFLSYLPAEYTLDIYGKGCLKEDLELLATKLGVSNRVSFNEYFIHRNKIPDLLSKYSCFIATTRMDAQGVMMCEAMANGLLTVTSNNTAIPEFVQNKITGLCNQNLKVMANEFLAIMNDSSKYEEIVKNAVNEMTDISLESMAEKEISLLKELIKG